MSVAAILLTLIVSADFDTDVLPVLTKAGCNAGACHGAAAGRGGFKLSLFAGDPAADYRAIVRDLEGRRVNFAHPERSLLLLKPTWELDHEGGQRFEGDSEYARVLIDWIRSGAPRSSEQRLAGIQIQPGQSTVAALPAAVQLQVTAHYVGQAASLSANGNEAGKLPAPRERDVTALSVYTPADPASTAVSAAGQVRVLRPGRHTVIVRFLTEVQAVQITAPYPASAMPGDTNPTRQRGMPASNNWIDDEINQTLTALRLSPAPRGGDAALLRRLTLDLTGRLPTPDRVRDYLADPHEAKFSAEIDRLLASPEFTEYWTYKLARWLKVRVGPNDATGARVYHQWLGQQIAASRPLDALVAELITADGDSHSHGPPNFHRSAGDARSQAEHVAESLLAVRLRCANCHNHPLDRWTQDDYHGLAAIFARLERGPVVRLRTSGEVEHPVTGEAARLRIPGERFVEGKMDARRDLADWVTSPGNRYFARAWVNRLWQSLLGRGLVEPVDDQRATNPATHPELLERLAADFALHQYDLRHTLRLIAQSAAYQRGSPAAGGGTSDERFYASALSRSLPPEVLLDAVCDATGVGHEYRDADGLFCGSRAIAVYNPQVVTWQLGPLAPCGGSATCSGGMEAASLADLTVQLHWVNGRIVNERLQSPASDLARLAQSDLPASELVDAYYLRTLSRLPSAAERAFWSEELSQDDRAERCADFAWSLLTCREFVTNH